MFSEHLKTFSQEKYEKRLPLLGARRAEVEGGIKGCSEEEQILLKFLYGTMPLRDAGEYGFSIFLGYVRHSLFVYRELDWCKELDEDMFLHHILYYRVNTENIEDCRRFFYDQLIDRIQGLSPEQRVLEINYWCAENGTYEASDNRTISPVTLYHSGKGRCGEESTFAVTAFRSVGIPARQVYTPRWAHCDDNHAWVEVYVNGAWHFLGACEPEEILDKGWFTNASSRALLVHTRTFSDFTNDPKAECLGKENLLVYYNGTDTYAKTKSFEILITDQTGAPVRDAHVSVEILNMAEYCSVANLYTDENGLAAITIGLGDIHIRTMKDGLAAECFASVKNQDRAVLALGENGEGAESEANALLEISDWKFADVEAPADYPMHPTHLTKDQRETGHAKVRQAGKLREERIASYFDAVRASRYPEEEELLRFAAGNSREICSFLDKDENPDRKAMLHSLTLKDMKDASAKILESHLALAAVYRQEWEKKGKLDIFVDYILCPRLYLEEMTDYRPVILDYFSEEEKQSFVKDPKTVWSWIQKNIQFDPALDYKTICSTPVGALKLSWANPFSQKLLFVAILRTLGVPARINPVNLDGEIWTENGFRALTESGESETKARIGNGDESQTDSRELREEAASLTLHIAEEDSVWNYYQTWTIGQLKNNQYVTLDYTGLRFENGSLTLKLEPGTYRLITVSRLPSGNQLAAECVLKLEAQEDAEVDLVLRKGDLSDLLVSNELEDFALSEAEGSTHQASELLNGRNNIVAFLSEGQEPTEHVLNEMLESKEVLRKLDAQILFVLRGEESLENKTLQKVLSEIPNIRIRYCDFGETVEPLARRMYVDPDKLPLLLLTAKGLRAVYGCSGYNVGSVDLMVKLLALCE